jgi:hypothetical protein
MLDEPADETIDDVAREMTNVALPTAFRANVFARLDAAPRGHAALLRPLAWTAAALCLVASVGFWWTTQRGPSSPEPAPLLSAAVVPSAQPVAMTTPATAPGSGVDAQRQVPVRHAVRRRPARRPAGLAWEAGPEALPAVLPIDIAPAGPVALDVPALEISPMPDIAPITIPAAGSGLPDPERRDR